MNMNRTLLAKLVMCQVTGRITLNNQSFIRCTFSCAHLGSLAWYKCQAHPVACQKSVSHILDSSFRDLCEVVGILKPVLIRVI